MPNVKQRADVYAGCACPRGSSNRGIYFLAGLILAVTSWAKTDYRDIISMTGPCVQKLAEEAEHGDVSWARAEARARCRATNEEACMDQWLVYAYAEFKLDEPTVLAVCQEITKRYANSAAAHLIHSLAIVNEIPKGGILRGISMLGDMRKALERAINCDPNCHPAREGLAILYSFPRILGGDPDKLKIQLDELSRRSPFYAALARGEIETIQKNHAAAAEYFSQAWQLDSRDNDVAVMLARSKAAGGDHAGAFEICAGIQPKFPGDGSADQAFVEASARTGLRREEALTAVDRYLRTAKGVSAWQRNEALIHKAIIMRELGQGAEADSIVAEAGKQKDGARKEFLRRTKAYQRERAQRRGNPQT